MNKVVNWIKRNIPGAPSGFSASAPGPDPQAQQISDDLKQLQQQADKLSQPVEVSVQGGYKHLAPRDQVVLGGSGGAVVGGAFGALKGTLQAMGSAPQIDPHMQTVPIMKTTVDGFDTQRSQIAGTAHIATPDGVQDVNVPNAAVRYHFEPKLHTEQAGTFQQPQNPSLHFNFTTNSVHEAAKFAVIGGVLGTVASGAYAAIQKAKGQQDQQPEKQIDFGDNTRLIVETGLGGAALGGIVGALDAGLEQARASTPLTLQWQEPVYHTETIGKVPQDASVMIRNDVRYDDHAFDGTKLYTKTTDFNMADHTKHNLVDVSGQAYEHKALGLGIHMEDHSQTFHASARYGMGSTIAGGIVLGGFLGVLSGVALNVIRKIVNP
jgi:hypothetical protein